MLEPAAGVIQAVATLHRLSVPSNKSSTRSAVSVRASISSVAGCLKRSASRATAASVMDSEFEFDPDDEAEAMALLHATRAEDEGARPEPSAPRK